MSEGKSPWGSSGGNNGGNKGGKGNSPWGSSGGRGGNKPPRKPQQPADLDNVIRGFKDKFGGGSGGKGGKAPGFPKGIAFLVVAALTAYLSIFTVQADEQAVILRFGEYKRTVDPGLHFKAPLIERKIVRSVTSQQETKIGISGNRDIPSESLMLTGDQNIVDVDFTVLWRIQDLEKYLFFIDEPENAVKAVAESVMREVVGQNDLDSIITTGRDQLRQTVQELVQITLDEYGAGILVRDVQFQKTDPPEDVMQAFLDVVNADQEAESEINKAEAYRNKQVLEAEGEAARMVQEAEAYRDRVVAEANGKAERFRLIYNEYKAAPRVTRQRMYLETMELVYGDAEKVIVDTKNGSGVVPYLPLNELNKKGGQ